MMLTEQSVARTLSEVIDHLREGRLANAAVLLADLSFNQITVPRRFGAGRIPIDPAAIFGRERVIKTGILIRACQREIQAGNVQIALREARGALDRWKGPKGA